MASKMTDRKTSADRVPKKLLTLGVLLTGVVAACSIGLIASTGPAAALFPINNLTAIDDDAIVNPSGQNIEVTGTTQCTEREIVSVNIRVEQDGVEASGQTRARCLGEETILHWTIHAATHGPSSFEGGEDAHVWAEARTFSNGKETDFHDWDEDVNVVERTIS